MTPTKIISLWIFLFFIGNSWALAAEPQDSLVNYDDSEITWYQYDQNRLNEFRSDSDFNYTEAPIEFNFWEKFKAWLESLIERFFKGLGVSPDLTWVIILKILIPAFIVAGIVYVIIKLIQSRFGKALFINPSDSQQYEVLEENIHEIDFQTEIEKSVELGEFRKAIRLVYLFSLKQLSDRQLIIWESGKTNHEYLYELKNKPLRSLFSDLGYYFEFTWYGNFAADRKIYDQTHQLLVEFQKTLDRS